MYSGAGGCGFAADPVDGAAVVVVSLTELPSLEMLSGTLFPHSMIQPFARDLSIYTDDIGQQDADCEAAVSSATRG
jgi:hypothetical protein